MLGDRGRPHNLDPSSGSSDHCRSDGFHLYTCSACLDNDNPHDRPLDLHSLDDDNRR